MVIDPWSMPYNGTVVSARRFVSALEEEGCRTTLLAIGGEPRRVPSGEPMLVGFEKMSIPGFNGIIDSMRVPLAKPDRARIRKALEGQDLLHVQFPFFLGRAAILEARKMGLPVICSFHVQPENILFNVGLSGSWLRDALYRLFIHEFFDRADHVIAPSAFAAKRLKERGALTPITVVSNGVPERFFDLGRVAQPSGERRLRVLSVGRLAKEKQQETLLRAVALSRHKSRISVTLVGSGPEETTLKRIAAQLGLDARIGSLNDQQLMREYVSSDLFVHCSGVELEGMSVLEAMATGNAVIVSDSAESACAEFVIDARSRFRVGDSVDLTKKIDMWLDAPHLLTEQGEANRRLAHRFTHQKSLARLLDLYREVVTGASGRPRLSADADTLAA